MSYATIEDTFAAYRKAAKDILRLPKIKISDAAEVVCDDYPEVKANEDDGADIAARIFVTQEDVPDADYVAESNRQRGKSYRNPRPPDINAEGAWVDGWVRISSEEVITNMYFNVPTDDRSDVITSLANHLSEAGFTNPAIDYALDLPHTWAKCHPEDYQALFDSTAITIGGFYVATQNAMRTVQEKRATMSMNKALDRWRSLAGPRS